MIFIIVIYIFSEPLRSDKWALVASKKECSRSEEQYGPFSSIDECAAKCEGISEMFIFGTNDYGATTSCNGNGACKCYCETSSSHDGTCYQVDNDGYRLFKYNDLG